MDKIKIAIVGYGGMGAYHAQSLSGCGLFIPSAYDIDAERCKIAAEHGYEVYPDYKAAAADEAVECVLIATPNDSHRFYTEYFLRAGKHVVCEKPAAVNARDFRAMVGCERKSGKKLIVHQNRRWDADYLTVREVIGSGMVGKVFNIESRVMGSNGIPGGWRKLRTQGGGMMLDWGVHMLDQLLLINKTKITGVQCVMSYNEGYEVDDGFKVLIKFADSMDALVEVQTNCLQPLPRWSVFGQGGTATVADWSLNGSVIVPVYSDKEIQGMVAGNGFTKTMAYRPPDSKETWPLPKIEKESFPFYKHLYDVIRKGANPLIANAEVLRVIVLMEEAFRAARRVKRVKI
ncbi:MAG: Gfo/Idh/MocA family oxidoreductase [Firmicutes bacterium]|nr:Gfo/Idh/MocA family oxidoreductase [Bacillota bacterium]